MHPRSSCTFHAHALPLRPGFRPIDAPPSVSPPLTPDGLQPPSAAERPGGWLAHDPAARTRRRLLAAPVVAGTGGVLGVAAWLEPASAGLGTHEQMGLPECGWILSMDLPCATCGMTTAFSHAADGHLLASLAAQPFGALLAVATAAAFLAAMVTLVSGSGALLMIAGRWWTTRTPWVLGALLIAAWAWKIARHRGML
ncbi:MAG: DUF2752 domain-containing protein [Planctomycetota bacterium]|jgi:hypothetical protein